MNEYMSMQKGKSKEVISPEALSGLILLRKYL